MRIMRFLTYLTAFILIANISVAQKNKGPEMVRVTGGTFWMGNDYSSNKDEKPEHEVVLKDFYISKYEVTNEEYAKFCKTRGTTPPSGSPRSPMVNVTWKDAVMYCNWLSSATGHKKYYKIARDTSSKVAVSIVAGSDGFRLPTEAEWEYAARGGAKSKFFAYSGSNDPDEVAWYMKNAGNRVHAVGEGKIANELGIFDMAGNCIEWCYDKYETEYYRKSPKDNPVGPITTVFDRVCRGGNYVCQADVLRNTKRFNLLDTKEDGLTGIRLARNE